MSDWHDWVQCPECGNSDPDIQTIPDDYGHTEHVVTCECGSDTRIWC